MLPEINVFITSGVNEAYFHNCNIISIIITSLYVTLHGDTVLEVCPHLQTGQCFKDVHH